MNRGIARLHPLLVGASVTALLLALAAVQTAEASAQNVPNPFPTLIARWEPCEPNTGVTVIVDDRKLGDGMIYVGCAPGEQASGVEALEHAGFALEGTSDYGLAFICRIDDEPTPEEQSCETTPGSSAYWSYWRGKPGGRWAYSGVGAKSPQSRSPINAVEGWSFGAGNAPRIEPMDGSGPSSFRLPPEQESSVIPAELARQWLAPVLDETAAQTREQEATAEAEGKEHPAGPEAEELLPAAIALARAGVEAAKLGSIVEWLARSCKEKHAEVEGCALRALAYPNARREEQSAQRFALAVLGVQALGQNPEAFAGIDLRSELEGMIKKTTGQVVSEGEPTEAVEVTAPTVLALARTGTLSPQALKTVDLILAKQGAQGSFEEAPTAVEVEAIQALAAACEQGSSVLGASRLQQIQAALVQAGAYLESIEQAEGGVPDQPGAKPDVESTALGAVGLALAGRQAPAERAAKWVSRYQVTAEYAGTGNPETHEQTPAEDVIGAFLPEEAALRSALAYGVPSSGLHGLYAEARLPTADALLALVAAGPYGPYDAAFGEKSLLFESRSVHSPSKPLAATVTNDDVRQITITGVEVLGANAGDFSLEGSGCIGQTLAPGASCELSASFDPSAAGLREAQLELTLGDAGQTLSLALSGTGIAEPESKHQEPEPTQQEPSGPQQGGPEGALHTAGAGTIEPAGTGGVLGSRIASPLSVQSPLLDAQGAARGLVGVRWRISAPGEDSGSWTIASRTLGANDYVLRASGAATVTQALLKLPPGFAYELQITFTDSSGSSSTTQIGEVVVPHDDRWSGLVFNGRWQRLKEPGAWLDTISRAGSGASVSARLAPGRPVFLLRATTRTATVEVRTGTGRQTFTVAGGAPGAARQITAAARRRAGTVTLAVVKGTIDLDGVADEG
jgi:hypothetical protein